MSADSENMSKLVGIFSPVAPPHTVKYYVIYVRVLFNFFSASRDKRAAQMHRRKGLILNITWNRFAEIEEAMFQPFRWQTT
jgi:hypothetical protein